MSCVWGKDGSLPLGRTLKTDLIKLHITSDDSRVITHQDVKASSVSDYQSKTWAVPSLKMVGLFLGWIFLNFPLKSAGANICMERLAIWTKTIPSWLWVSQGSGLSSTTTPALPTSSKDISDTDDKRGTAFTCYGSAWMKLLWRSSALYCLSLLFFVPLSSVPGTWALKCEVNQRDEYLCSLSALTGPGCLASYSNTPEWGRC